MYTPLKNEKYHKFFSRFLAPSFIKDDKNIFDMPTNTRLVKRSAVAKKVRSSNLRVTRNVYEAIEKDAKKVLEKADAFPETSAGYKSPYFNLSQMRREMKNSKNIKASKIRSSIDTLTKHIDECTDMAVLFARHRVGKHVIESDYNLAVKMGCGYHKKE